MLLSNIMWYDGANNLCVWSNQALKNITVISGRLPARPITRTGRLLHTEKKKSQQITRTGG